MDHWLRRDDRNDLQMEKSGEGPGKGPQSKHAGTLHGSLASLGDSPAVFPTVVKPCVLLETPLADRDGMCLIVCYLFVEGPRGTAAKLEAWLETTL